LLNPRALCPRKQAIVSSSPAAASVALQLAQLVGVAESHGFKKDSSAVFADLPFWVLKATFFVAFFLS
ncbi:hypothetical protein, partial [Lactiplantibacillus plantarum]|uniref:hypothetical protein n=1 Tax=Lactiplantibacillus plantarum TaxID=1590 RepID=UPI002237E239